MPFTATECHLPYWITSVTFHPTQVNTPYLNPSQTGRYSIYLPRRDGRLSWTRWLVTYRDGLPAHRWSPIQVLIQQCMAGSESNSQLVDNTRGEWLEIWCSRPLAMITFWRKEANLARHGVVADSTGIWGQKSPAQSLETKFHTCQAF